MKNQKSTHTDPIIDRTKSYINNMDSVTLYGIGLLTIFAYMGIYNFFDGISALEVLLYWNGLIDLSEYKFAISLIPVFLLSIVSSYLSFKSVINNASLAMTAALMSAIIITVLCYFPMAALNFAFNFAR